MSETQTRPKVSKYSKRQSKLLHNVERRVNGVYDDAYHFKWTFQRYLDEMKKIWESKEFRELNSLWRARIHGINDTLFHRLYEYRWDTPSVLMNVSRGPDGRLFGEKDDSWLKESPEYKSNLRTISVWRRTWGTSDLKIWDDTDYEKKS